MKYKLTDILSPEDERLHQHSAEMEMSRKYPFTDKDDDIQKLKIII